MKSDLMEHAKCPLSREARLDDDSVECLPHVPSPPRSRTPCFGDQEEQAAVFRVPPVHVTRPPLGI